MSQKEQKPPAAGSAADSLPNKQVVSLWYQDFASELLRFCKGRAGRDDGEEVFQTVWTKAISNLDKFDGTNPRAWLYRIARNAILDLRKKRKPELNNLSTENRVDPGQSTLENSIRIEENERFEECVKKLDPSRQQLLRMRVLGDSYQEIAKALAVNIGTVGSRFNRIKEELRSCVEGSKE